MGEQMVLLPTLVESEYIVECIANQTDTFAVFSLYLDMTKEDPLSQESFRKLALPLPYSKKHHSKLVCYISKELMDTENLPQVFPNGYVYSAKALKKMTDKNGGEVKCPRTGLVCKYTDLVKANIYHELSCS
ncbi:hypothetical protein YC2023_091063 [Brassica napus]